MNGYVNAENYPVQKDTYSDKVQERPMHPGEFLVWCAFWFRDFTCPYHVVNDVSQTITITNFIWPEADHLNTNDMSLLDYATLDILYEKLESMSIIKNFVECLRN